MTRIPAPRGRRRLTSRQVLDRAAYEDETDIEAARALLVERGVDASEPFHFGPEGQTPGLDPERRDYDTFRSFNDPDRNGWLVQEVRQAVR